jgi:hypothetical protein
MKQIQLTQGQVALVDDEDYECVNQYKWLALFQRRYSGGGRYQAARVYKPLGTRHNKTLTLHAFLIGDKPPLVIDHINGDPLDNRRVNLRHVTRSANSSNALLVCRKHNKSGYRGVSWQKANTKWRVGIKVNNTSIHLGYFTDKREAAKAYNAAAIKYHGEFATLNPIEGDE